jgi:hypothetical protein
VVFTLISANYTRSIQTYTGVEELTSGGPDNYNNIFIGSVNELQDPRINVMIDGVSSDVSSAERGNQQGTWEWTIFPGSTMACEIQVTAGVPV